MTCHAYKGEFFAERIARAKFEIRDLWLGE